MFRPRRRMRGSRGSGIGLFLLMAQLMQVGFNHIPPTTLATIALNVAIYLKVLNPYFEQFLRPATIRGVCVSSHYVWYKSDWTRLFLAGWFHLDDMHLYYNMASFLWKGRGLEGVFGSFYFAYLIMIFSVLTNAVMVAINIGVGEILEDGSYVSTCAAGFSGVIFALKVLSTHYTPAHMQRVFGIPVPSAWACWIELVLIQLLVPNASFTGHLAGILVGLAYINGPLKAVMDMVFNLNMFVPSAPSYTYTAGTANGRSNNRQHNRHAATAADQRSRVTNRSRGQASHTYRSSGAGDPARDGVGSTEARGEDTAGSYTYEANDFTGGMTEEEQLEAAILESTRGAASRHPPSAPPSNQSTSSTSDNLLYPTLPPHPDSTYEPPPVTSAHNSSRTLTQPSPYPSNDNDDPLPTGYVDQDELRRRRLARFDR